MIDLDNKNRIVVAYHMRIQILSVITEYLISIYFTIFYNWEAI